MFMDSVYSECNACYWTKKLVTRDARLDTKYWLMFRAETCALPIQTDINVPVTIVLCYEALYDDE